MHYVTLFHRKIIYYSTEKSFLTHLQITHAAHILKDNSTLQHTKCALFRASVDGVYSCL